MGLCHQQVCARTVGRSEHEASDTVLSRGMELYPGPSQGTPLAVLGGSSRRAGWKETAVAFSMGCLSPPVLPFLAGRTDTRLEQPGETRGAESKVPAPGAGTGSRPRAHSTPARPPAWPMARPPAWPMAWPMAWPPAQPTARPPACPMAWPTAQVSQRSWEVGTELRAGYCDRMNLC